jgi:hypothetical protein
MRVVVELGLVLRDAQDVGLVGRDGAHAVDTGIDAPEQFSLLFWKRCSHLANLAVLCSCQTISPETDKYKGQLNVGLNALREREREGTAYRETTIGSATSRPGRLPLVCDSAVPTSYNCHEATLPAFHSFRGEPCSTQTVLSLSRPASDRQHK